MTALVTAVKRPAASNQARATLLLLPILVVYVLVVVVHRPAGHPADEEAFLIYARNLTHGFYAETHTLNAALYLFHGPALPILLAPLVALHVPVQVMRILLGPVPIFLTVLLFHRMMRDAVSERGSLLASYALAAYLPFFTVIRDLFEEPLAILCFTLVTFFLVRAYRGGRRDHIWAGVSVAILAMSRFEYGYVLFAALVLSGVWLAVSRQSLMARRTVEAAAIGALLCAPWLAYTYSITHKPFYWGNSGSLSLYWMSAPGNLGDFHDPRQAVTLPQLAPDRPLFQQIVRLPPLQQDARLQHVALQNIRAHPEHYLANVVNNVDRLIFSSPFSFTNEKASSMLYGVPNALLLGAMAVAICLVLCGRGRLAAERIPIVALLAMAFVIHVPLSAYARFLFPLIPVTAWLVISTIFEACPAARRGPAASRSPASRA